MPEVVVPDPTDFEAWREAARRLVAAGVPPERVAWRVGDGDDGGAGPAQPGLFDEPQPAAVGEGKGPRVPLRFLLLARRAALHADPGRFALLYRLLWRIAARGERWLPDRPTDADMARALAMARAVERAAHRLKAFLRFREVWTRQGPRHVAWFEPEHHVLELCAPFLARRFATMRWTVVTPYRSACWDGADLAFGPGGRRDEVPAGDALDEDWRAYYASVFDPARLNPRLMRAHMPERYWRDLPEARAIPGLVAAAAPRALAMVEAGPTAPARKGRVALPPHARHRAAEPAAAAAVAPAARPATLAAAAAAAAGCRACPLWEPATRTVFGEGPADAPVMLVGEQPGDSEDLEGRPFVGPAGRLLDRALAEAGLDRSRLYLTNAVKHFRFAPRGRRRVHQRPDAAEVEACGVWLALERELLRPRLVVALGATAARSLLGREVAVGRERGRVVPLGPGTSLLVTAHPSRVLRLPDPARRAEEHARLVADLRLAAPYLGATPEGDATAAA